MPPDLRGERVVFFTGAGISAESGVPTYRGRGGIWGSYDWQDFACQRAFDRDPQNVLDFHEQRRAKVLACEPNAAHRHIAALQAALPSVALITQNTDGLHPRAGARNVIELHGSLWRVRCAQHGAIEDLATPAFARRTCAQCGATLRPDIVWFEDALDPGVVRVAEDAIRNCTLFVAIGTSAVVWPAAGLIPLARSAGARMIEINLEDTEASPLFDTRLRGAAATLVPEHFPVPGP